MYPELVTRGDLEVFLPPIGGQTAYVFGDPRALAVRDLDDARMLERLQRLAHRRAPDPVGIHQRTLRGQWVAGRQFAGPDPRHQSVDHLVAELATADRRDLGGWGHAAGRGGGVPALR